MKSVANFKKVMLMLSVLNIANRTVIQLHNNTINALRSAASWGELTISIDASSMIKVLCQDQISELVVNKQNFTRILTI